MLFNIPFENTLTAITFYPLLGYTKLSHGVSYCKVIQCDALCSFKPRMPININFFQGFGYHSLYSEGLRNQRI